MSPTTRMAQRLINSDLVMQWTRSMGQRGWYLHLRLGGISVVFARYSLVFASGGGFSMMSMNVTSNDELQENPTEHCTGGDNVTEYTSIGRISQSGICRYR